MFTVIKVTNSCTNQTYYGYSAGDDIEVIKKQFLHNATGANALRGDVKVLNGCNHDDLVFTVHDVCDTEEEAHLIRNEARVEDIDSVTGPSVLPIAINTAATKMFLERAEALNTRIDMLNSKTARQAFANGLWSGNQIQSLLKKFSRADVVRDLDKLTPVVFSSRYNSHMVA
jgi:hypothetical protein